jgi:hypothetical protein
LEGWIVRILEAAGGQDPDGGECPVKGGNLPGDVVRMVSLGAKLSEVSGKTRVIFLKTTYR